MNTIDNTAVISPLADIEISKRGTRIVIGPRVLIDAFVKIKTVGGVGDVIIEEDSCINSGTVMYSGNGIKIGKHVLIAANCTLAPVNHSYIKRNTLIKHQGFLPSKGGIIIGDDVWIGSNCTLLDGAKVSTGVVVGACSLVRGELKPYGVYSGNPLQLKGFRLPQ